jgi:hypothetical protein
MLSTLRLLGITNYNYRLYYASYLKAPCNSLHCRRLLSVDLKSMKSKPQTIMYLEMLAINRELVQL